MDEFVRFVAHQMQATGMALVHRMIVELDGVNRRGWAVSSEQAHERVDRVVAALPKDGKLAFWGPVFEHLRPPPASWLELPPPEGLKLTGVEGVEDACIKLEET